MSILCHPKGRANNDGKSLQCVSPLTSLVQNCELRNTAYQIIGLEAIQQIQGKYYCTCEINQNDCQTNY